MTWASVNEECETTEIAPETDTVHFTDATVKRVDWSWKTVQAKYLASQYSHRHQQSSSIRSSRELAFPPPTELSVAWPNINPKLNDTTPGSRLASRVSSVIRRAHLAFKSHKLPTEKTLINGQTPKQLFRRVAHIIARMVDVCYRMKMYAVEAGLVDRYLVPISMQAPRGKKQEGEEKATGKKKKVKEESFVFDLDYFLINKKNDMPKPVTLLMEKNPDERTEHDLELIGREVWKIPSFRKYSSRLQRMMCRIVRYMKCGKRRVVLRKGHIGYNVYYIYSGSVNVLLEKDDTGIFVKPEVVVLKKGACFGEIALLENTRRNATIVCAEPTEFIVIDKEDYVKNGLSDQMKEETRMRFEFFRNWKPLAQWSDTAIHALSYISRTEDFVYNRVIVADSQRNEWLWFIAKGNGELLRFIDLEKCTNPLLLEDLENKGFQFLNTSRPNDPPGVDRRKIASEKKNDVVPGITLTKPGQMVDPAWQGMPALLFGKKDRKRLVSLKKQQLAIGQKGESTDGTPAPDLKKPTPGGAGKGIYLRIDTLVQGQCMGLESLFPETDVGRRHAQQRYSLVSQGCTVIHLPRVKFRYRWDILGLTEVRWTGFGDTSTEEGHKLWHSGEESKHQNEIAFHVNNNITNAVICYTSISNRLMSTQISTKPQNVNFVQVYSPTSDYNDDVIETFYEELKNTVKKAPTKDFLIVQGD
ncbi:Cyclic nucleotide-binding domain-containing protein 2 [Lamellibrachia satsuma]|nr:Cyclic nucleotide-binding domain-containing protein 2 [Lamellibrachia satsuma]